MASSGTKLVPQKRPHRHENCTSQVTKSGEGTCIASLRQFDANFVRCRIRLQE